MWLLGVLVSGAVSVSEGFSPLPPLSLSTPLAHSQLIALISAVMGAATKSVCLTVIVLWMVKLLYSILPQGDGTVLRRSVADLARAILPL
jgi:hypothetical protein